MSAISEVREDHVVMSPPRLAGLTARRLAAMGHDDRADREDREVYRDPRARTRAAELARMPKATLVDLVLDARTGTSRASLMKWHRQVLAWTITCAERAGHHAEAVTDRGGAPAAGTASTGHPPARTAEQSPAQDRPQGQGCRPVDRQPGAPDPAR